MHPILAGLLGAAVALVVVGLVWGARRAGRPRRRSLSPEPGSTASPELTRVALHLPTGAMVVGVHDEVLVVNDAGLRMGLARGTRVGFPELLNLVRSSRANHQVFAGDLVRERDPGTDAVQLSARIIPLDNGVVLVITTDESAHRRVDAVRRDFVANVSHELKTPIGAIGILAEAIESASDEPEEVSRFAERLQEESRRLSELVSQIIELSRLQSADPLPNREVVDVDEVVDEALSRSRELANNRGVNLIRARGESTRVMGDRWQLIDAVTNLVQNAIVYSDKNARVAVTVIPVTADGDEFVEIKVADNGIGISDENQRRIFERFYRVDFGRSRDNGGTGLGLSIVRHIAGAHGGSVRVWSRLGQGSTFTLRIPAWLGGSEDTDESEEE